LKKLTSKQIDPDLLDFYLKELRKEGAQVIDITNPYEVFRLKHYDSTIIAYSSGKITYLNTEDLNNLFDNINQRIGVQEKRIRKTSPKSMNIPKITSIKIKKELIPDLINKMTKSNYEIIPIKSQHESQRYKKENFNTIIYKTGSIVYTIEPEIIEIIKELLFSDYKNNNEILIGQDETGKGEWWGPMTVASVAMKVSDIIDLQLMGVMDSKKLKDQKINYLFNEIQKKAVSLRVISIGTKRFNELYEQFHSEDKVLDDLLAWGHSKALEEVLGNSNIDLRGSKVIIDEFNKIKTQERIKSLIDKNNLLIIQEHKADVNFPIVSIASICARYARNIGVNDLEKKYKINFKNSNPNDLIKLKNCEEFIKTAYIK